MPINPKKLQFKKSRIEWKGVDLSAKRRNWKLLTTSTLGSDKQNNGQKNLNQDWNSLPKFQYNYLITKLKVQNSTKITKLVKAK